MAKQSMGSLAFLTVVGKPVAGAGSGPCIPFPVYSQYWNKGMVDFPGVMSLRKLQKLE